MSVEVERIRKLVSDGQLVDAVELPSNHRRKTDLLLDLEEALAEFDDDANYAHFVVRVKRSEKPLPTAEEVAASSNSQGIDESFSLDTLVSETLEMSRELSEDREKSAAEPTEKHDPAYLFESAKVLEENGEHELARTVYRNLAKKGHSIAKALAGIARAYEAERNVNQAVHHYEEAIAYASEVSYYQALAALQIRVGRDAHASETLIRALGAPGLSDLQKFDFHKSLGNCYTRMEDHAKAEHHYLRAYELNSDSDSLQVNVGTLALQKGDAEAARKHFERALELNAKNDRAVSGMGMAEMASGKAQRAHGFFVESLKLNPNNLGTLFNLAKCAYELKKFDEAARLFRGYIDTNPPNTNVLYTYAGILYHQGKYGAAKEEVDRILASNPDHAGARELGELIQKA
ncbi:MAG: tetratricopeptide repeat protein [Deltaproteobacteria bacterium]|nr:tetratricopeptide repeat protein [Deltaproteobacteria bacterium]